MPGTGLKVLVVDDNADNRHFLELLFRGRGYAVASAANGAEALAALQQDRVDLIVSDILMPTMDGYRLCRECKRDAKLRDIPFLFATTPFTDPKDEAFARSLGADGFVAWPIEPDVLMSLIDRVVAQRSQERPEPPKIRQEARHLADYAERVVSELEKKVKELETEVAARRHSEEALQEREERLRLIAETIDDVFWISTPGLKEMLYISPAYERIWERSRESLYGNPPSFLEAVHPDDRPEIERILALHSKGQPYEGEYRIVRNDGRVRWMHERGFPIRDAGGRARAMTGVISDITDRKRLEQELEHEARTDALTGAANRRHFFPLAREAMGLSRRYRHALSLLMLDIDHFKAINDAHGHQVGDQVLKSLVQVCRQTLRDVDVLGRIGGEEFTVLLPETEAEQALQVAERLRQAIATTEVPLDDGKAVRFTVSIGVATLTSGDGDVDAFLNRADRALYEAKEAGRNRVRAA